MPEISTWWPEGSRICGLQQSCNEEVWQGIARRGLKRRYRGRRQGMGAVKSLPDKVFDVVRLPAAEVFCRQQSLQKILHALDRQLLFCCHHLQQNTKTLRLPCTSTGMLSFRHACRSRTIANAEDLVQASLQKAVDAVSTVYACKART